MQHAEVLLYRGHMQMEQQLRQSWMMQPVLTSGMLSTGWLLLLNIMP